MAQKVDKLFNYSFMKYISNYYLFLFCVLRNFLYNYGYHIQFNNDDI